MSQSKAYRAIVNVYPTDAMQPLAESICGLVVLGRITKESGDFLGLCESIDPDDDDHVLALPVDPSRAVLYRTLANGLAGVRSQLLAYVGHPRYEILCRMADHFEQAAQESELAATSPKLPAA